MTISLGHFDKVFLQTIDGHKEVKFVPEGIYHTILVGNKKTGIVGYIPTQNYKNEKLNFVQIVICPEWRGKGITELSENLLAKTYKLPSLYATINTNNIASIKAHQKAGFKELDPETIYVLKENGFLKASQTRLKKIFYFN